MPFTKAVFLDRDGVLNAPAFNPKTNQHEAPHLLKDLKIYAHTFESVKKLQDKFALFVVSNQPDYALGKAKFEDLLEVEKGFGKEFLDHGICIQKYYYCYHHPHGIVPEYSILCACRKPKPFFLEKAAQDFQIDLKNSWMVGDRDTDVQCGQSVGCKTILVENPLAKEKQGQSHPTRSATDIKEAVEIILNGEI